jgi:FAD binding domain
VLNLADRRPDFAAGKNTLAVLLSDGPAARLVAWLHAAAYASIPLMSLLPLRSATSSAVVSLMLFATLPYGYRRIVRPLLELPYRKDNLLAPTLLHSMLLVWPIVLHVLASRLLAGVSSLVSVECVFAAYFAYVTVTSVTRGRRAAAATATATRAAERKAAGRAAAERSGPHAAGDSSSDMDFDETPLSPVARVLMHRHDYGPARVADRPSRVEGGPQLASQEATAVGDDASLTGVQVNDACVVVVGGGVAGLVTAASLQRLGLSAVVLERRGEGKAEHGADLALWPAAVRVMRELGVEDAWFERWCYRPGANVQHGLYGRCPGRRPQDD